MIKKIDLKYATLPAGYTEESFMEIADSIHEQWAEFRDGSEEESGWGGDAGYGTPAAIFPRFKSFIVFVGSDTVFGFDDVNDRDCVLGDYYEDCQNLLNPNAKPNGSARIVIQKKEEAEIEQKRESRKETQNCSDMKELGDWYCKFAWHWMKRHIDPATELSDIVAVFKIGDGDGFLVVTEDGDYEIKVA